MQLRKTRLLSTCKWLRKFMAQIGRRRSLIFWPPEGINERAKKPTLAPPILSPAFCCSRLSQFEKREDLDFGERGCRTRKAEDTEYMRKGFPLFVSSRRWITFL